MTQEIETPKGWEWQGPCLTRVHEGKFAVLDPHPENNTWWWAVYAAGQDSEDASRFAPLAESIQLANDQLGVPKPVEVVRTEYSDAWILTCEQTGRSYRVSKDVRCRDYADFTTAMHMADQYVRGAS